MGGTALLVDGTVHCFLWSRGHIRDLGTFPGDFATVAGELLATANEGMGSLVLAGYGVEPAGFYAEAMRLLQLRLRSIGFLEAGE